ncbi:MAG TPA: thiolase domain-containing protein [Methanomicrobia archaeon]|nr:MAG: thiolase domain-containing protein [Thermococci archaeon]RLF96184.1 MAG: thiolase domain-containing protein [Thermococci archaeon]HDN81631.1 thiolase domain-containing protein [Methanomicrobia archaeon]
MRKVAVVGVGITRFGELWNSSLRNLTIEAGIKALNDAGVPGERVDALYTGCMSGDMFIKQGHIASLIADYGGLLPVPSTRVESACASGGLAVRQGLMAIASGMANIVVVGGVEKMTDALGSQTTGYLASAADQEWESFNGATFPSLYALMARRHMYEYGTTEEQLSLVAVKNHHNGSLNPNAHFQFEVSLEKVMNSSFVADPLRLFHCSPVSDGAACVVLASEDKAKELSDDPIWIIGSGQASGAIGIYDRDDICTIDSTVNAGKSAYKMAGITPKDIDFAEVHDCFTIAEIINIEDLGFFKKGEGGKAVEEGITSLDGELPINPSGGLKAKGHPVGATGVAQVVEAVTQLRGKAGKRQIKDAEIGLTHNIGGSGGTAVVHIFSR